MLRAFLGVDRGRIVQRIGQPKTEQTKRSLFVRRQVSQVPLFEEDIGVAVAHPKPGGGGAALSSIIRW